MDSDQTTHLQALLDRIHQGDETARNELLGCAYERLRLLAKQMLHQDFPRLVRLHGTGSVANDTVLKLFGALPEVELPTVRDFFRFAAYRMRCVLLEMARTATRGEIEFHLEHANPSDAPDTT